MRAIYTRKVEYEVCLAAGLLQKFGRRINIVKIQPFNTEDNLLYKPEYITGFISERYSVGLDESWESAQLDIRNILKSGITSEVKSNHFTNHVRGVSFDTDYSNIKFKYLLLPIWLLWYP